jgi:flavodoxin long chain
MFRFEDSDPRYLIAIEEKHTHDVAPYRELMQRWAARFARGELFGVILMNIDHDHDEETEHERDVDFEEAFTQMLNDFRRDHKASAARCTVGFARIFPSRWITGEIAKNPAFMDEIRANQELTSRYMFGVTGNAFLTVDEARTWIDSQIAAFVLPIDALVQDMPDSAPSSDRRVGLFYGSTTGVTEMIALEIQNAWTTHGQASVTAINIGEVKHLSTLLDYDYLILGIPTWNVGQLQDDWAIALPQLDALDFTGKHIALFGIGDQYGYPDNYLDAVGMLGTKLIERGATLVGRWSASGYEFSASKALVDGAFMGLALDEVQQSALTDTRVNQWIAQIITEFALQSAVPSE